MKPQMRIFRSTWSLVPAILAVGLLASCASPEPATPSAAPTTASPSASPSVSALATTPAAEETTPAPTTQAPVPGPGAVAGTTKLAEPVTGAVVAGPTVKVSGVATAFEANINWRVLKSTDLKGKVVKEGFTMAGANGEVGPYNFTVDLDPGKYRIEVFEASAKDGSPIHLVYATFTVK